MMSGLWACILNVSTSFSDIMNNKVFYQHPNLMRVLGMHETVMEVMVNVLGGDKSQVGWLSYVLANLLRSETD